MHTGYSLENTTFVTSLTKACVNHRKYSLVQIHKVIIMKTLSSFRFKIQGVTVVSLCSCSYWKFVTCKHPSFSINKFPIRGWFCDVKFRIHHATEYRTSRHLWSAQSISSAHPEYINFHKIMYTHTQSFNRSSPSECGGSLQLQRSHGQLRHTVGGKLATSNLCGPTPISLNWYGKLPSNVGLVNYV